MIFSKAGKLGSLVRFAYLHGFASSPSSRKAQALGAAFLREGVRLEVPLLDDGNFEAMTITSQLSVIERCLGNQPARLVGSSMGGYLAALYAASHPEMDRAVLLAPAFRLANLWENLAGIQNMRVWRETGTLEVFHYGSGFPRRIGYGLYSDTLNFPPEPAFPQPALILHGRSDETVPIALSREFALAHPNATLLEVDSDHELGNVLDTVTEETVRFLLS